MPIGPIIQGVNFPVKWRIIGGIDAIGNVTFQIDSDVLPLFT